MQDPLYLLLMSEKTFEEYSLSAPILKAVKKMGFVKPTPIQAETISLIQEKRDLIGLAKTGSGKTAACAIPVCDRVDTERRNIQALIIVPTRELALQYATEAQKIGEFKKVKTFALFGGEDGGLQEEKLKHGVQVLVATPGRLIDFIYTRRIDLSSVETLILDEADEMLSMGFYDDLEFIIDCLIHEHQTLLFSATMAKDVRKLALKHLNNPHEVTLIQEEVSPETIEHHFQYCHFRDRDAALEKLILQTKPKQAIIFCRSRHQCEQVCRGLGKKIKGVDYLHGGLSQDVRTIITGKFRSGRVRYLVATDVASRGLDFSNVTHIFNYELSDEVEVYVHRAGRTGRQERKGEVYTLITKREVGLLDRILKKIKRKPNWIGKPAPLHSEETKGALPDRRRTKREFK